MKKEPDIRQRKTRPWTVEPTMVKRNPIEHWDHAQKSFDHYKQLKTHHKKADEAQKAGDHKTAKFHRDEADKHMTQQFGHDALSRNEHDSYWARAVTGRVSSDKEHEVKRLKDPSVGDKPSGANPKPNSRH